MMIKVSVAAVAAAWAALAFAGAVLILDVVNGPPSTGALATLGALSALSGIWAAAECSTALTRGLRGRSGPPRKRGEHG